MNSSPDHAPDSANDKPYSSDMVPRASMLDVWSADPWVNGAQIDDLEIFQRVHVRTCYSLYEITVIDGRHGEILIRGGLYVPEFTRAHLCGATMGGSFCKMRGIYPGFNMEFSYIRGRIITTSTVQTVAIFSPRK